MGPQRDAKRYAAYFRGWAQAFGEHEGDVADDEAIGWLYGEGQVGLILPGELRKVVQREMLGGGTPRLVLAPGYFQAGEYRHPFREARDRRGAQRLIEVAGGGAGLHLYLTYHFMYPSGTRIVTFSQRAPLGIMYKEIEPAVVRIGDD